MKKIVLRIEEYPGNKLYHLFEKLNQVVKEHFFTLYAGAEYIESKSDGFNIYVIPENDRHVDRIRIGNTLLEWYEGIISCDSWRTKEDELYKLTEENIKKCANDIQILFNGAKELNSITPSIEIEVREIKKGD